MKEISNAEYLYRWGQQLTGDANFGLVIRRAQRQVNTGRELSLNDMVDAFEVLRSAGLVKFSPPLGERNLGDFLDRANVSVEFLWPADWESRLSDL